MLSDSDYVEFRRRIIDNFDVYDLVEFLGLTVEDWLDNTTEWEDNLELREKCGLSDAEDRGREE